MEILGTCGWQGNGYNWATTEAKQEHHKAIVYIVHNGIPQPRQAYFVMLKIF